MSRPAKGRLPKGHAEYGPWKKQNRFMRWWNRPGGHWWTTRKQ